MSTVGFSRDNTQPLMSDIQYMEPYASSALNRKFKHILLAGFYSGFKPLAGKGLNLLITSSQAAGGLGTGAASIDTNGFQISVQQMSDITIELNAGKSYIIALQADYQFGVITDQVDANSDVKASQIVTLDIGATLASNQIELCRVAIPSGTTQITQQMISTAYRIDRLVGIALTDRFDMDDRNTGASARAVKLAYDALKKYADDNKAAKGVNSDITALNSVKSLGFNALAIGGYVTMGSGLLASAESRFSIGTFSDPWVGKVMAIKANGGIAVNGDSLFNDNVAIKGTLQIDEGAKVTGGLTADSANFTGNVVGAMPSRVLPSNYGDAAWHKIANLPNAGTGSVWLTLLITSGNYGSQSMGQDLVSLSGRGMPANGTTFSKAIAENAITHVQLMKASDSGAEIGIVPIIEDGVYKSYDVYIKSPQWWNGATVSITGGNGYNYGGNNITTAKSEPDGIQYATPVTALTTRQSTYDLSQADAKFKSLSLTNPLAIQSGGTGARNAADARDNLGLGSAALRNIGTSGANVPLMNTSNTWDSQQSFSSGLKSAGEILSSSQNALRLVSANAGLILRKDENSFFLLIASENSGYGQWNALRPFSISLSNGLLQSANGQVFSGNTRVNDTLTLANALSISNGGTGANNLDDARGSLQVDRLKQNGNETQLFSADGSRYIYINANNFGAWDKTTNKVIPMGMNNGGTGASDAAGARNNLGLGSAALMTSSAANYDGLGGNKSEAASTLQLVQLRDNSALKNKTNTFVPVQYMQAGIALSSASGGTSESNGLFNGPADGSDYSKYNVELRTWWGLAIRDTCNNKTNIVFDARTGDIDTIGTVNTKNLNVAGNYLTLIGSGTSNAQLGSGGSDIYLYNTKSAKHLQLKDDGTLQYENQMIYHTGNKPSMQELLNSDENTGNLQTISTGDDLNDYKTCGMWVCRSVNTNATNAPATNARYNLTVIHAGVAENGTTQIAYVSSDASRPRIFVRCYSNKTWSLWVDMASNVFPNGITVNQGVNVINGDLRAGNGYLKGGDNNHYIYVGGSQANNAELGTYDGYFALRNTNGGTIFTKFENGKITTSGNINLTNDNSMINVGNDNDFALVKKTSSKAKIVVGNGTPFVVAVSNAATVDPSNTQTDLFRVDTDGSGTFKNNLRINGSTLTLIGGGASNLNMGSGSADVYLQNSKSNKYLQLSDDGFLRYSGSKVYHEGNKPTTAELGFSIDNNHYFNTNDEKRKWVKVATVNLPQGGQCAYLTIYGGAGYNAGSIGQAAKTEIILRAGNGSPANSITAVAYVQGSTPIEPSGGFGWKYTSSNNYEIWANVRNYTQGHIIEGRSSNGVLIDYSDSAQSDKPDGLTSGTLYFMQYGDGLGDFYSKDDADGRFVNVSGDSMLGALNFANATWNKLGDDVEIADMNQGGMLCIRSQNDANRTGLAFYQKGAGSPSGWMQCYSGYVNFTNELRTGDDFTAAGYSMTNKEFISKGANGLRITNAGTGILLRKDGNSFYMLTTNDDTNASGWTTLRPFYFDLSSGRVTMANGQVLAGGQTLSGNTQINDTLTLANALDITNGGTGANSLAAARQNLKLDRLYQEATETQLKSPDQSNYVYISNDSWGCYKTGKGFIALGLGQGGTGATDAAGARNNLQLAAGAQMTKSAANYDGLSGNTNEAATTTQLVQLRNATPLKHQANIFGQKQTFNGGVEIGGTAGGSNGLYAGNGDGADFSKQNLLISSWWGIGFHDSCNNATNIVMDTRSGNLLIKGFLQVGQIYTNANIQVAWGGRAHSYQENGDIVEQQGTASIFRGFWSATTLSGALRNITNRADDAWNKANDGQVNRVQDIRLAGQDFIYAGRNAGQIRAPSGAVLVGAEVNGEWDNNERLMYAYIQKLVNGNWYTIGQA